MKDPRLRTYVLFIKGSERNEDFNVEVEAKDQSRALKKMIAKYPQLKKFDWYELLDRVAINPF